MSTDNRKFIFIKKWWVSFALFILALLVRVISLGGFATFDEPRWINRSRWFLTGLLFSGQECPAVEWGREFATQGLGCTLQIGYPGVTTMWAGSLGLLLHYWQTASNLDFQRFLVSLPTYNLNQALIAPTRLPLAIIGALFVPAFYLLLRRLFNSQTAGIAALIVALHPFHIALSRIVHHDGLNSAFMVLSSLALIGYWLKGWQWYWLPLSAILGGLALLSKQVSWFMPPYVIVLAFLTWRYHKDKPHIIWELVWQVILWGVVAGLTFTALFPAMWVMPVEVIKVIFNASTSLASEGHVHYFLGEISTNPGLLFYPLGWLLRSLPFELLGLLAVGLYMARQPSFKRILQEHPAEIALFLFVLLLLLFVNLSNKKMVRYFLPAFPVIDIFVAMGLLWLKGLFVERYIIRQWGTALLITIILLSQGGAVVRNYPYYLTYYNPLFGGIQGASHLMTIIGWGEGLNEAADYLNRQPGAESAQVLTERICSMLQPFFKGRAYCLNSSLGGIMKADYIVYYHNVVQRDLQQMEQWSYFDNHQIPVYSVIVQGLDYALIYRNPIQYHVDRKANSLSGVFTIFGYNLVADRQLAIFWQNIGLKEREIMVGLAPIDRTDNTARQWISCVIYPAFADEMNKIGAIIESLCTLTATEFTPGMYELQFALRDGEKIKPLDSSGLVVLMVTESGDFEVVELK